MRRLAVDGDPALGNHLLQVAPGAHAGLRQDLVQLGRIEFRCQDPARRRQLCRHSGFLRSSIGGFAILCHRATSRGRVVTVGSLVESPGHDGAENLGWVGFLQCGRCVRLIVSEAARSRWCVGRGTLRQVDSLQGQARSWTAFVTSAAAPTVALAPPRVPEGVSLAVVPGRSRD